MRFLALELDGRTTLDRTRQGLYGVVMGQHASSSGRPHAEPGRNRRQIRELRRLLLATVQRQSHGVLQLR